MKIARPSLVGAIVGSSLGMLILSSTAVLRSRQTLTGPMLGEHGGAIRRLVMQYTGGSAFVWPVYRQFLQFQSADVTVYMVCPSPADFSELRDEVSDPKCRIIPVFTGHPITTWARDRWIELERSGGTNALTLLAPRGELDQEIWPARAGDSRVAAHLASTLEADVHSLRSDLYFDGGDLLSDDKLVFAAPAVLRRNIQHTVATREELIEKLENALRRPVTLMNDAPDHHAGMYMMSIGADRMLVGDPSLAAPLLAADAPALAEMDGGPDFSQETQRHFDSVAKLAADHGYHVWRIPTVPGENGKQYLTYTNVIMDVRDDHPIVYMPTYKDQPKLNAAATKVWESMGFKVLPIDCSTVWPEGGTLHCLVNVLNRAN